MNIYGGDAGDIYADDVVAHEHCAHPVELDGIGPAWRCCECGAVRRREAKP